MIRRFVRSVIHNATVTHADRVLLEAIGVQPLEEVEIVNVATGERFTTWIESGSAGEVRVHGGTAHHVRAGDVVTILSYGLLHDGQTLTHRAKVVTVDAQNHILSLDER
jgi:aspartate 1-decarboxylase